MSTVTREMPTPQTRDFHGAAARLLWEPNSCKLLSQVYEGL